MEPVRLPPAGWYGDPVSNARLRWWSGAGWTDAVAPAPGSGVAVVGPAHPGAAEGTDGAPARRIPARAAWWALLGIVVGELAGGAIAAAVGAVVGSSSSAVTTLAGEVGLWAGLVGSAVLVSHRYGTGSLGADYGLRARPVDLAWGLLAAFGGFTLEVVVGSAMRGTRFSGSNTQLIEGQRGHAAGAVVITLVVAVGAPLVEELFFRGLLRTALRSALGPAWSAVSSGVLFGCAHLSPANGWGNVEVVLVIGGFGVLLGLIANRTGRLAGGMVGHALFNVVASLTVLLG